MFRIRVIHSVAPRVRYFIDSPALSPEERTGRWLGAGAAAVGLGPDSPVARSSFRDALHGFAPNGTYLGLRRNKNRRAGWDMVLSSNKSISVAALCADPAVSGPVREAWNAAVRDFIPVLESLAARSNAGNGLVATGNLMVAAFTHERSRRDDPLIHTHLVVMNATRDRAEVGGAWRGLEAVPFFRHNMLLDAAFQRELHRHLVARGLPAVLDKKGRAHFPDVPEAISARLSKAKRAIDEAIDREEFPGFADFNRDTYRNLVNDRIRPPKRIAVGPLPDMIDPDESRLLRRALRPRPKPEPDHDLPPITPEIVAPRIHAHLRASALWTTPKKLFAAILSAAREMATAPLSVFLEALPSVADPSKPAPGPATVPAKARARASRIRLLNTAKARASALAARKRRDAAEKEARRRAMLVAAARSRAAPPRREQISPAVPSRRPRGPSRG